MKGKLSWLPFRGFGVLGFVFFVVVVLVFVAAFVPL